jgi:hypothetical protein
MPKPRLDVMRFEDGAHGVFPFRPGGASCGRYPVARQ